MTGSVTKRWLWVTPAITDHRSTGALVYSLSLAEAVAEHGVDVTCVGLGSSAEVSTQDRLRYVRVDASPRRGWRGVMSALPNQTSATALAPFRRRAEQLSSEKWDAVVIDGLQTGWLASQLGSVRGRRIVYVAHNHESSMRVQIARSIHWRSVRRPVLELDALKTRRLEREVLRRSDVVSSISAVDLERFRPQAPHARHVLVSPGWSGALETARLPAMGDRPLRVGVLGSFEWHAKQEGLRRFLHVADPAFSQAGIELVIAGKVPDGFRRSLGELRATTFLGWVDSADDVLASWRVGAIAEPLGGGFKLKALDYVFSDVVVATLSHSAAGLPLTAGSSMIVAENERLLVDAIVESIGDPVRLQRMAAEARAIGERTFSWSSAARALVEAVEASSSVESRTE